MKYKEVYDFLMSRLENETPGYYTYHNADHTKAVIDAAEYLGKKEGLTDNEITLVKTAALFHDAGFLQQAERHEEISCIWARDYLHHYGYNADQIEEICRIIIATRLPQSPKDHLAEILCDADLYYIGKEDYAEMEEKLFKEYQHSGHVNTKEDWQLMQAGFLASHRFFTKTAIAELEPIKQKILTRLNSGIDVSISNHGENRINEFFVDMILTISGIVMAGIALKLFLVPNHFFDGGITGISLLVHEIYDLNLGMVILGLYALLIAVGYFKVGNRFAFRTLISIILLGISLLLIPNHAMTADKFLISIFGGAFLGIGIGLIMRTGAALDGIEVLALYTIKRTSFTITEIILAINILIFIIAGFRFGIETALYSILTYFSATRCIDYVVEGLQAFTGVTIVSGKSDAIKYQLVNKLGRGITVYKGERGFLPGKFDVSAECDIIFTVITRLEMRKLKNLVYEVDPNAFVFANTIKEASGGVLKRRHKH